MPSIRASALVNLSGWQPAQNVTNGNGSDKVAEPQIHGQNRSPFMHASMPLMASTNDALTQFYGPETLPQQRILPAKKGGQSI